MPQQEERVMESRQYVKMQDRNRKIVRKLCRLGFLLPGLLGVCAFYLLPFGEVVRRSFLQSATGVFVAGENYRQLFTNQAFWRAVRNTAAFVGIGVPALMCLSLAAALFIRRAFASRKLLSALLLPMAVPAAVMVVVLQLVTDANGLWNGLLAGLSGMIPFLPELPHGDYMNTKWALLIVLLAFWWKNTGYMAVLWLTGLAALPRETEEAAAVDGAGCLARLLYITIPQLSGSFFTILMLSILQSFKSYREIWMAAGSYPQENIYLLQHLLQNWYLKLEFDRMAALTVVLAALLLVFCVFLQRRLEQVSNS